MRLALIGDLMFYGKFCVVENPAVKDYLSEVADYLDQFDHVIGNLESPFIDQQKQTSYKSAVVKSDPQNVQLLKQLHVDVVTLANNHVYDFGSAGLENTKGLLDAHGIQYFGVDNHQVILDDADARVALHGYCCYSTNPMGLSDGVNSLDVDHVETQMRRNHDDGYLNIVSIHGGEEHVHTPNRHHLNAARQWAQTCPYVFFGHHPHVVQGHEVVDGSLLAYSVGNFCIDEISLPGDDKPLFVPSEDNKWSVILELEVQGTEVTSFSMTPIYLGPTSVEIRKGDLDEELVRYNQALDVPTESYVQQRSAAIAAYAAGRRSKRTWQWYRNRLNYDSVRVIRAVRRNSALFNEHVVSKVNEPA